MTPTTNAAVEKLIAILLEMKADVAKAGYKNLPQIYDTMAATLRALLTERDAARSAVLEWGDKAVELKADCDSLRAQLAAVTQERDGLSRVMNEKYKGPVKDAMSALGLVFSIKSAAETTPRGLEMLRDELEQECLKTFCVLAGQYVARAEQSESTNTALRTRLSEAEKVTPESENEWRPISEARHKDGTRIIGWDGKYQFTCRFVGEHHKPHQDKPGWFDQHIRMHPTLWRKLPRPPARAFLTRPSNEGEGK